MGSSARSLTHARSEMTASCQELGPKDHQIRPPSILRKGAAWGSG